MKYRWGCIGCGHIANEMAQAMEETGGRFSAVYSRTRERAAQFAERFGIATVYESAGDLFCDETIDIIYIATPHNRHIDYILEAARHGKHILCEKAITLNSDELTKAISACEEHGVILAEAMTIYHMPVFKQAAALLKTPSLGKLKMIEVNLGSSKEYDMTNRFFNPDLAGGAILDIGVYALSFVRFFFSETASEIQSVYKLAPSGVDEQAVLLLKNGKDEMAGVTLSLTAKLPRTAVASFENGYIEFESYNRSTRARVTFTDGGAPIVMESDGSVSPLAYEIEDMEKAVSGEGNEMRLDFTGDVMEIMTRLRREWGVIYKEEQ